MLFQSLLKKLDSRYFAVFISLLLSLLIYCHGEPINRDGMLYLYAASSYLEHGLKASMQIYPWPFYQLLIAWSSQLCHLSLPVAAHCLDALLSAFLVTAFISLVKELSGKYTIQWLSAFIILIYPALNHDRMLLIRDFGYWAFALFSLCLLLRYTRTWQWRHALGWAVSMTIASLFRIEGIILLLLLPAALLLPNSLLIKQRIGYFLRAYSLIFLAGIGLGLWLFKHPGCPALLLGRLPEIMQQVRAAISSSIININTKAQLFAQTALSDLAKENARPILIGGLLSLFLVQGLSTLHPLFALLSYYGISHRLITLTRVQRNILICCLLLNISMLLVFLSQQFFLSPRYIVFPCLILMLWVPFSIEKLSQHWHDRTSPRWLFPLLLMLLLAMGLGAVHHFGPSKAYLKQAGTWLQQNTPAEAKIYSNSQEVLFYARHNKNNWLIPNPGQVYTQTFTNDWHKANYVAWRINFDEQVRLPFSKPITQIFQNKRGDRMVIFVNTAKE